MDNLVDNLPLYPSADLIFEKGLQFPRALGSDRVLQFYNSTMGM